MTDCRPRGGAEAAPFFDAIAGRYERDYALSSAESRRRMERVLRELAFAPAPLRVLDLGVGTGRELTALLDAGHAPTGLDASRAMLDCCARRARPVPLVLADLWAPLPFEEGAFDAAVALHGTLAHPPDDQAVARLAGELARVVRAGGALVFEVPSPAWLDWLAGEGRGDRRVRRTGPGTGVFEDLAASASIEVRLLDEAAWGAALSPAWDARVDAIDELEWFVVARRR